jgi:hypothetical protein
VIKDAWERERERGLDDEWLIDGMDCKLEFSSREAYKIEWNE